MRDDQYDKIIKARTGVLANFPFFGRLLLSCKIEVEDHSLNEEQKTYLNGLPDWMRKLIECFVRKTACVNDSKHLRLETSFLDSLSAVGLSVVLVHEILHLVLRHTKPPDETYTSKLFHELWTYACELKVNSIIMNCRNDRGKGLDWALVEKESGVKGIFPNPSGHYTFGINKASVTVSNIFEKSTLELYLELKKLCEKHASPSSGETKGAGQPPGSRGQAAAGGASGEDGEDSDSGEGGEDNNSTVRTLDKSKPYDGVVPLGPESETNQERNDKLRRNEDKWKKEIQTALEASRNRGTLPSSLTGEIEELLKPKLSYKTVLRRFMTETAKTDYSWAHHSRKAMATGVRFPGMDGHSGHIVMALDTSGSVWDKRKEFLAEVGGVLSDFPTIRMDVMICDAELKHVMEKVKPDDLLELPVTGGGGTSHKPVVDAILEKKSPSALMLLTDCASDLESELPRLPPGLAVLLVVPEEDTLHARSFQDRAEILIIKED